MSNHLEQMGRAIVQGRNQFAGETTPTAESIYDEPTEEEKARFVDRLVDAGVSRESAQQRVDALQRVDKAATSATGILQGRLVPTYREIWGNIMDRLTGGRYDGNKDGIPDRAEAPQYADDGFAPQDTDKDGIPDYRDSDADGNGHDDNDNNGNGVPDAAEAPGHADDGFADLDSGDGDGPSSDSGSGRSSSGGGFASQGGNTSPVGGPNSNPGNRGGSSGNNNGDGPSGGGRGNQGGRGGPGSPGGPGRGDHGGRSWPIVMDLDGDGVELVALDESAAFYDINADGYQYNLGWAGRDDALLAYDKNGDGDITAHDEISFVGYKAGARTDWEGLMHFDSNNDGVLDNRDAGFAKFRVWQDADGDGDIDAGELKTLAQRGIRSLDLNPNYGAQLSPTDRDGNLIYGEGGYTKTDGTRGVFGDVALAAGAMGYRVVNGQLEFKSADGVGKVYVAPANAGGVNMNFAASVNAAHIGAIGGSHADVLNGGGVSRDLLLFGDEGNDRLTGGSGNDWLAGGAGADILRGGGGHDVLFFEARDDVHGGGGQDVGVVSGSGAINLSMGAVGLEALHSGDGNDRLSGADSAQGVIIDGGGGADTMRGSHHRDVLSGGAGNDHIKGKPGDDVILGGAGDDDLFGNFGDDVLFGGEGDDYLNGLVGDDALYGGAGSDTYDFGYPNVPMGVLPDFGRETVRDSGGANDKVTFGRRRHEDLWLAKDGDDLRISILGGDDEVLIEDHFAAGGEHRIEHLSAATRIYRYGRYNAQTVSIDALVNAMAQFDKPQAGWSHMSAQQRADVHAAWRSVGIAPTVGG